MLIRRYFSDGSGSGGDAAETENEQVQDASSEQENEGAQDAPEQETAAPGGSQQDQSQAGSVDELPDWAQRLVKELRSENASHRKAKRQAETEAEAAARKAAEEQGKFKELYEKELAKREAAEAEAKRLELDALKSKVATEVGLPPALASRLAGETEDEIRADAQAVLAALPKQSLDNDANRGTGGSGGQAVQMSDEEIKEFAARMGVDPKYVKPEHFRIAKK